MMRKKMHPPAGSRPGTLAIHASSQRPRIRVVFYDEATLVEEDVADVARLRDRIEDGLRVWVDVQGLGDERVIRELADLFSIHPLALEDVVNVPGHPKAEIYENHLLIIARMVLPHDEHFDVEQVGLVVGHNHVVSFQERQGDVFEPIRNRLRSAAGLIRRSGPDYLAYALWDAIVDAYFPVVESLSEQVDDLEDQILERPTPAQLRRLSRIRSHLVALRRSVVPQGEAVRMLIREENPFVTSTVRVYLRDVHDHCVQTAEVIDTSREVIVGLMSLHLAASGNRTNEVMKLLTLVASLFVPLTFIAGLYGMNFKYMPEIGMRWAYPAVLGLMVTVAAGMLLYFWRKGWLWSPEEDDEDEED